MNLKRTILATLGMLMLCLESIEADLVLLQAIFRHGNRAPTSAVAFYPKDPYINMTYSPMGVGGLTNTGKMVNFKLGEFFRKRYDEFLGPFYTKQIARFRADEVERIVMTGQLVAAGMFPPIKDQEWHGDLVWQPIPVWAPPFKTDYLYNAMFCEKYKKLRVFLDEKNKDVKKNLSRYKETFEFLSKHTGTQMTSFKSFLLRQQLYAQRDIGLKLPEWTKTVFPCGVLDEIAANELTLQSYTPEMKRMLAGVWLGEWIKNIDEFLNPNGRRNPKVFMYAAHEMNIAPILIALNVFDDKIPSYGCSVILELHEIGRNDYYVKLIQKDKDNIQILHLPSCGYTEMCPLKVFKNITAPLISKNPSESCGTTTAKLL